VVRSRSFGVPLSACPWLNGRRKGGTHLDRGSRQFDRGDAGRDAPGRSGPSRISSAPPKERLSKLEKALIGRLWQIVRGGVEVKLLPQQQELYVLAKSHARINKERAMRRRKLKWLWPRLKQIAAMEGSHARKRWARQSLSGMVSDRYRGGAPRHIASRGGAAQLSAG
jgi:hypothetical protein